MSRDDFDRISPYLESAFQVSTVLDSYGDGAQDLRDETEARERFV